jgi:hypothetical protein
LVRKSSVLAACLLVFLGLGYSAAEPLKAAVFDFELVDTSLDGEMNGASDAELQRVGLVGERLREALDASERYQVVDIAPVREASLQSNLQACGGCDRRFSEQLGADVSVTGVVHKVSNLILNMSISIRDVQSGEFTEAYNVDFRSNSDDSWMRAVNWLIKNRLLRAEAQK